MTKTMTSSVIMSLFGTNSGVTLHNKHLRTMLKIVLSGLCVVSRKNKIQHQKQKPVVNKRNSELS